MSYKCAFRYGIRKVERARVNIDDAMADAELAGAEKAKILSGSNGNQPERFCECDELIVNGKRIPVPPGHDCEYVAKRSELVKVASMLASAGVPKGDGDVYTRAFAEHMERLSAELLR